MKLIDFLEHYASDRVVIRNAGDRVFEGRVDDVPNCFLERDVLWFSAECSLRLHNGDFRCESYLLITLM